MDQFFFNNIIPSKTKTFDIGSKKNTWKNIFTKNLFSKNAHIKNLTVEHLSAQEIDGGYMGRIGPTGSTGPTGPAGTPGTEGEQGLPGPTGSTGLEGEQGIQGIQGVEGPALFTLYSDPNVSPVEILGSNYFQTTNSDLTYIINTLELYQTAFLTAKVNSGQFNFGFISSYYTNTFAFSINSTDSNYYSIAINGGGSTGSYSYSFGDIFTICLTSVSCKFFQNGLLVFEGLTNPIYQTVFARFFVQGESEITSIAYGYLNDLPNVIGYSYNINETFTDEPLYFIKLSDSTNSLFVNCLLNEDKCFFIIGPGIYNINVSFGDNSTTSATYNLYWTPSDSINWQSIGNSIPAGTVSGSISLILNLSSEGFIGLASYSNSPLNSDAIGFSVNKLS